MLRNYFKIAWRALVKHKACSAINIIGLAVGLAAFIFITLYVQQELSFDKFNKKTALLIIVIAVLTVSFQAIKAAIANPVKSLRTE